ncbi:MAG: glycosyltransferase [Saprospiraceae bacterium]|nr:glycosyltransferase [Saprospiraceae bacterium]
MVDTSLTLIIPCYNPRPGWAQRVAENFQTYYKASILDNVQLTFVNDGSTENVSEADFQYLRQAIPQLTLISYLVNGGKGHALREGVRNSQSDFYIFTDVDFPYTLESMLAVEQALLQKKGIAVGHRNTTYYEKVPLFRKVLSQSFRWFIKHLLSVPVEDSQCGLKGFDEKGKEIFLKTSIERFLFDLEFLVLANKKVLVYPVSVELKDGVTFTTMGLNILWRESRNFLKILNRRITG